MADLALDQDQDRLTVEVFLEDNTPLALATDFLLANEKFKGLIVSCLHIM
jgi:hypothetical protein